MNKRSQLPATKTREEMVAVFNQIMGQPISDDPEKVPLHLRELAINLIFEELKELAQACGVALRFLELCNQESIDWPYVPINENEALIRDGLVDKELQLDALADVQYTTSWAINVLGHSKKFEQAFEEVCMSNDSKACSTMEEAEATKMYWEDPKHNGAGEPCHIETIETDDNTYFVVKRTRDGKVRKSVNYLPANFKQFFI